MRIPTWLIIAFVVYYFRDVLSPIFEGIIVFLILIWSFILNHIRIILYTVSVICITIGRYLNGTGFLESLIYGILTPLYVLFLVRSFSKLKNKDKKEEN